MWLTTFRDKKRIHCPRRGVRRRIGEFIEGIFWEKLSRRQKARRRYERISVIEQRRPPTFSDWSDYNQTLFDHQTYMGASMEGALKRNSDRQEELARAQMYAFENEINNRYMDDRNRRMHEDYLAGRPIIPDPPVVDYTTLPPYDGSVYYPVPPLHHSQWVDPHTGQLMNLQTGNEGSFPQQQGDEDDGSGAFGFGAVWRSLFGP